MIISSDQLAARLKTGLAPIYFVAGEEPLLVQECADLIRRAAAAAGFAQRELLINETGFDWSQLRNAAQSLSLFAAQRRIELYLERSPGTEGADALKAYAAKPPSDVLLLIVAGPLEKTQRESIWYKTLADAGVALYLWPVKPQDLRGWLQQRARSLDLALDDAALAELEWRVQGNLLAAVQALQRLKLLAVEGRADRTTVIEATGDMARFGAFDLVDAALEGRPEQTLRRLERLREEGAAAAEVMGALVWALQALGQLAQFRGPLNDAAWRAAKLFRPDSRPRYAQALKRLGRSRVAGLQIEIARAERVVKGAAAGDPWQELVKLCAALGGANLPSARPNPA